LRMPLSTGTDWFLYDFARVYARVPDKLTIASWLEALKAGRCQATNGPLLSLTVDGKEVGETVRLDESRRVTVRATAVGRHDFQRLQLIHNGKVIDTAAAKKQGDGYAALLTREVVLDGAGWFAVRIDTQTKNELGRVLYAHSSPVYVEFGGKRIFDPEAARGLLRQVEEAQADIRERGTFSTPEARDKILNLYEQAARDLATRMEGKP